MSAQDNSEQGSAHLLLLLVGLLVIGAVAANVPLSRHYADGKSNVQGVFLARGGDDSNGGGSNSGGPGPSHSQPVAMPPVTQGPAQGVTSQPQPIQRVEHQVQSSLSTLPKLEFDFNGTEHEGSGPAVVKSAGQPVPVRDFTEVEKTLENEGLKIATAPGQLALVQGRSGAVTNLPVQIDPTTKTISVTTPNGTKQLTVLPDDALKGLLASRIMDQVSSVPTNGQNGSLASITNLVQVQEQNGVLGYEVQGQKDLNVLGFIPVKMPVSAFVSAENGQVVSSQSSFLERVLSRVSF